MKIEVLNNPWTNKQFNKILTMFSIKNYLNKYDYEKKVSIVIVNNSSNINTMNNHLFLKPRTIYKAKDLLLKTKKGTY